MTGEGASRGGSTASGSSSRGRERGRGASSRGSRGGSGGGGRGGGRGAGRGGSNSRRGKFGGSITTNGEANQGSGSKKADSEVDHQVAERANKGKQAQQNATNEEDAALGTTDGSAEPAAIPPPREGAQDTAAGAEEAAEEEEELCWICAEPVRLYSVGPCNHRTCHICALRLRALYKVRECTFCKSSLDRVVFTTSQDRDFGSFTPAQLPYSDAKLGISFETQEALEDTLILLRFNCPDERCDVASTGWADLKMHANRDHDRLLCDLCVRKKNIFAHEHTLHTRQSLAAHMRTDHRFCEFCNQHFYSDDELFPHMRDRHEQCHICKLDEALRWQYFRDYKMLETHFRTDHFLCPVQSCLEQKFVVFDSEMDFKAHQVAEHGAQLSSKELKDAMRVEANFRYEDPATQAAGSSSGRRGRKGNRNQEPDPTPRDPFALSALALRPNVPGAGPANHTRRIHFGGHTTSSSEASREQAARAAAASASQSAAGGGSSSDPSASTVERHEAFLARVNSVMGGSDSKVQSFRSSVRVFRAGEMSANDLVDTIHSLVGDVDNAAVVVNGLVDLLEDSGKKQDVLSAWNRMRVERTQFPSLVPLGNSSGAVRSVKRGTAANSDQIWANVERAALQRGGGPGGSGWGGAAASGSGRGRGGGGASAVTSEQHFPTLGSASSYSTPAASSTNKKSVPGSAAHSAASHGGSGRGGIRALHGSTPWSSASSSTRVAPPSAPSPPKPYSPGHYPISAASKLASSSSGSGSGVNGSSSSSSSKPSTPRTSSSTGAFPALPMNASAAALAAHKKAVLSHSSSRAGSGTSTPVHGMAPWANGGRGGPGGSGGELHSSGRIDSPPTNVSSPPLSRAGSSMGASGLDMNDLGTRLDNSSIAGSSGGAGSTPKGQQGSGGGGGKKKNKGVAMMAFGGVHRGGT
ncbi:unnamed protein product [Jaminaea pallidilutea]